MWTVLFIVLVWLLPPFWGDWLLRSTTLSNTDTVGTGTMSFGRCEFCLRLSCSTSICHDFGPSTRAQFSLTKSTICRTNVVGLIHTTWFVVKSWLMLVRHNIRKQNSYHLNRPLERCRSCRESTKRSKEREGLTLGVHFTEVSVLLAISELRRELGRVANLN